MAESSGDSVKDTFVVSFGESDGGHSFVTLADAINAKYIKSVQPQDDVWGAIDALKNGSAQIAVIPFSNKITAAEAATVAGLASGELKILGQIQRQTNHVLVGLKHNIKKVAEAANKSDYADWQSSSPTDGKASGGEITDADKKQFVFLLHVVHSSKTVFDQTRGKLTGSDFRSTIKVEHTPNPMRVLLRDHRDRKTQAIVNYLERNNGTGRQGPGAQGGYAQIVLHPEPKNEKPIEQDFFSAAVVAEGLLDSANMVCSVGPGSSKQLCSQRLSEITEHLAELKTDVEAPLDLPNNVTTFLVVQAAGAKLGDAHKKEFPWATESTRFADKRKAFDLDIKNLESKVAKFEAAISTSSKQLDEESDPMKALEIKEQISRLEAEWSQNSSELSSLRDTKQRATKLVSGPGQAKPAVRAAFHLSMEGSEPDWSKSFKQFEDEMSRRFSSYRLKFDQSPEVAVHQGKHVFLATAKLENADAANAGKIANDISGYFKALKDRETRGPGPISGFFMWLFGISPEKPEKRYDRKLLGVYPSWSVGGADRDLWTAEGVAPKPIIEKVLRTSDASWQAALGWFFALFIVGLVILGFVTATPTGSAMVMSVFNAIIEYFLSIFIRPS